jgi:cell division protein FtsQ
VNHVPIIPQTAPTWRDSVAQDAPPRPRGRTGRTRLALDTLRHWLGLVALAASLVFGYMGWRAWRENPAALAAPASGEPVREIVVRSDGVLDRAWVETALDIAPGSPLMQLDLPALRERLLRHGQVANAVVARRLPDALVVTLEERSPVLRLRGLDAQGAEEMLYVARDGSVFPGSNYDEQLIATLPWLAGVNLLRDRAGTGFVKLDGMEAVADLLSTVRSSAPAIARDFQVVSLARFAADGVLLVRTPEVAEIAFGTGEGYRLQIARLDYILDELRARGPDAARIRSINLAVGGRQIPVAFEAPENPAPSAPRRAAPAAPAPQPVREPAPSATPAGQVPVFFRI